MYHEVLSTLKMKATSLKILSNYMSMLPLDLSYEMTISKAISESSYQKDPISFGNETDNRDKYSSTSISTKPLHILSS